MINPAIRILNRIRRETIVFGRVACLGQDVFRVHFRERPRVVLVNQQKARADLLTEASRGAPRPDAGFVTRFLARQDIAPLIAQQESLPWFDNRRKPGLLIMDSYSELTDQKFTHRSDGWSFCANYSDLEHDQSFTEEFDSHGLLPIHDIEEAYFNLFAMIESRWPNTELLFIHFPTKFDSRQKFKDRGLAILDAITGLRPRFSFVRDIQVNDADVRQASGDTFPYHFDHSTFEAADRLWSAR